MFPRPIIFAGTNSPTHELDGVKITKRPSPRHSAIYYTLALARERTSIRLARTDNQKEVQALQQEVADFTGLPALNGD